MDSIAQTSGIVGDDIQFWIMIAAWISIIASFLLLVFKIGKREERFISFQKQKDKEDQLQNENISKIEKRLDSTMKEFEEEVEDLKLQFKGIPESIKKLEELPTLVKELSTMISEREKSLEKEISHLKELTQKEIERISLETQREIKRINAELERKQNKRGRKPA